MKQLGIIVVTATISGVAGGVIGASLAVERYGAMPHEWASWRQVSFDSPPGEDNSLGGVVGQVARVAMPRGGPQAFEGYTYLMHPEGTTKLAIGTLGNVEVASAGSVKEVRTLQGGGVISGTGKVDRWVGLSLHRPRSQPGQIGSFEPIVVEDPAALTTLRGTITTDAIRFTNGWVFRPEGTSLQLVDPQGVVRQTFPRE